MAKQRKSADAVTLTSPSGAQVTVSAESADTYKARGYTAPATKSTRKAASSDEK